MILELIQSPRELDALICQHVFGWQWYSRINHPGTAAEHRWLLDPNAEDVKSMLESGFLQPASKALPLSSDWLNQSISPIPKLHQNMDACMRILDWERQNLFGSELSLHLHSDGHGVWAILEHPDPENQDDYQRFYGFHLDNPAIALCLALLRLHGVAFQYLAAGPDCRAPKTPKEQERDSIHTKAALLSVSRFWYRYRQQKYAAMSHPDFQKSDSSLHQFVVRFPCGESIAFDRMIKKELGLRALSELDADRAMFDVNLRVSVVSTDSVGLVIPVWKPDEIVFIPISVLPDAVRAAIRERKQSGFTELIAKANLHATTSYELYLDDFRLAVDPREQLHGIPIEGN